MGLLYILLGGPFAECFSGAILLNLDIARFSGN
jgi:hypothetical protein